MHKHACLLRMERSQHCADLFTCATKESQTGGLCNHIYIPGLADSNNQGFRDITYPVCFTTAAYLSLRLSFVASYSLSFA